MTLKSTTGTNKTLLEWLPEAFGIFHLKTKYSTKALGKDINNHRQLVEASKEILKKAIYNIRDGVNIADIGQLMETEAKK